MTNTNPSQPSAPEREGSADPGREIGLEPLTPEDAGELHKLETACFSHPWTEEQLAIGLGSEVLRALGARHRDRLVGYCSILVTPGEAEIINIAVIPEFRGRGLGRRLMVRVLQNAAKMGIETVYLEVRVSNTVAASLYESLGFVQVGVRKKYYPDTGEDARIMRLELASQGEEGGADTAQRRWK